MRKDAVISVIGTQKYGSEAPDKIELVTNGIFGEKDGKFFVMYNETELTGMEGTKTTIKTDKSSVFINRTGTTSSKLNFKNGERNHALYKTQYGPMNIATVTDKLSCDFSENGGKLLIGYDVEIDDVLASRNSLEIEVRIEVK